MKLLEFMSNFSDEERCKEYYRDIRQKEGIICKKCGCEKHYWLQNKWQFQCSSCKFRTTLCLFAMQPINFITMFIFKNIIIHIVL
jgi:hypothetical protein